MPGAFDARKRKIAIASTKATKPNAWVVLKGSVLTRDRRIEIEEENSVITSSI
jgi:hypothetical protein